MKRKGASMINVMVFMLFSAVVTAQVFFFMKNSMESVSDGREIMNYRLRLSELVEYAKDDLKKSGTGEISHDPELDTNTLNFYEFYEGSPHCEGTKAKYRKTADQLEKWEHPSSISQSDWDSKYKAQNANGEREYYIAIHDLDYTFREETVFNRNKWINEYSMEHSNMYKKLFAAMPHDEESRDYPILEKVLDADGNPVLDADGNPQTQVTGTETRNVITARYYLIRAYVNLPASFFGRKLMYQVLVRRNEEDIDKNDNKNKGKYHRLETLSFQEVWF